MLLTDKQGCGLQLLRLDENMLMEILFFNRHVMYNQHNETGLICQYYELQSFVFESRNNVGIFALVN